VGKKCAKKGGKKGTAPETWVLRKERLSEKDILAGEGPPVNAGNNGLEKVEGLGGNWDGGGNQTTIKKMLRIITQDWEGVKKKRPS